MDWLAMVTVDEVVALGKRVNTIEELEDAVKEYVKLRIINRSRKPTKFSNTNSIRKWTGS
jgi:hypothetical protein